MKKDTSIALNRREFLRMLSYSIGTMAMVNACENPIRKAIPYLIQPEDVIPGKSSHYASVLHENGEICPIVVKVRDGRPIKIEGNELCTFTKGGSTARTQASLLGLYDPDRLKNPSVKGEDVDWENVDQEISDHLNSLNQNGTPVYFVAPPFRSPSTRLVFQRLAEAYPNILLFEYHHPMELAMLQANHACFGRTVIPSYNLHDAKLIISLGADFLGTWLAPVEYASQYSEARTAENTGGPLHIQLESTLTITGSKADKRIAINPSEQTGILLDMYNQLSPEIQMTISPGPEHGHDVNSLIRLIKKHKEHTLIISSSENIRDQLLVNAINHMLGSYGSLIDMNDPQIICDRHPVEFNALLHTVGNDTPCGFIFYQVNPVYDHPLSSEFQHVVQRSPFKMGIYSHPNETCAMLDYICPDHHYLESWNDIEYKRSILLLSQPLIHPLFNSRQMQDSLLKWAGSQETFHLVMKENWRNSLLPHLDEITFQKEWMNILQRGVLYRERIKTDECMFHRDEFLQELSVDLKTYSLQNLEIDHYQAIGVGNGHYANNPWLQEMPDPLSKVCWDNYALISEMLAGQYNLQSGDMVMINDRVEIPVLVQPGQAGRTISIALGYGRENSGRVCEGIGVNANLISLGSRVEIRKTNKKYTFAWSQTHASMEGRDIVREFGLNELSYGHNETKERHVSLYGPYDHPGHHWAMSVDLDACTGCTACVIACQVENNVPVVGREEVKRGHIMHWIEIDRYYEGDRVHMQPLMCQHCDAAPCENVCPVSATSHSAEGISQMAYNRCIGTRYCANNCPYKTRRFNWFDYTGADTIKGNEKSPFQMDGELPRMSLNPDVTIRAKGVIEKCSFCIQRIQEAKMDAKLEGREITDGDIKPACVQACPSKAIHFGDVNDNASKISKITNSIRAYRLLSELNTLPSVTYLAKVKRELDV